MSESSTKPYFIRAVHDWCTDNGYTPYLAVSVNAQTDVPREYVRNGEIVLNVGVMATSKLDLGNEFISFQARFNGAAREVFVPVGQVTAIYARETGHGMAFEVAKPLAELPDADGQPLRMAPPNIAPAPLLVLANPGAGDDTNTPMAAETGLTTLTQVPNSGDAASRQSSALSSAPSQDNDADTAGDTPPKDNAGAPARSKPTLTRVK
jgi:stringent starvation protein B